MSVDVPAKFMLYSSHTEEIMIKQVERVLTLFRDNFHCGMRLQFIDLEKLKAKYESEFGEEVPFSDDVLKSFIQNNGFETEPNK